MSEIVVCRYCDDPFVLQSGKPGCRDECPACLIERSVLAAQPIKSRLEKHLAASGLTADQVTKKADRLHRALRELLRALGVSHELIESVIQQAENSPIIGSI